MNERQFTVRDCSLFALEDTAGPKSDIILLHGDRFSAATWQDIGTLGVLRGAGYRVHALDMPGCGRSPSCPASPVDLLYELLKQEEITSPVLLKNVPHLCYVEQTDHWHRTLVGFLDEQGV